MTLSELRETIQTRELKGGEVISGAWTVMEKRFGMYFLLALLVFLPSSLITEIVYNQLPAEPGLQDTMWVYIVQVVLNLYTMISLGVTAIMVENQLKTDEVDSFGSCFYTGIRRWPRFLVTMIAVGLILGASLTGLMMIGMMMPILMVPALAFIVIVTVMGVVLIYDTCTACALRRYMLMPCVNYVRSILKDHVGKSVGVILLLTLISSLIAIPIVSTVSRVTMVVNNPNVTIAVNTIVNTVVSVVNIFSNIGVVLFFMNLEFLKFRELGAIE